jgi:hypothetical protein
MSPRARQIDRRCDLVDTLALRPVMRAVAVHRNNAFACRLCKARLMAAVWSYRKQTNDYLLTVKANQPTVQANRLFIAWRSLQPNSRRQTTTDRIAQMAEDHDRRAVLTPHRPLPFGSIVVVNNQLPEPEGAFFD